MASIKIYMCQDDIFYCYITVEHNGATYDVNLNIYDAIKFAQLNSCDIIVKKSVLEKQGIKITKALIEAALSRPAIELDI